MFKIICSVMLFVGAIFLATSAGAQNRPDVVNRPDIKPGDSWKFQKIDEWSGRRTSKYSIETESVSDKEIRFLVTYKKSGVVATITETLDLNMLTRESSGGVSDRYIPNDGSYTFPLAVGKTWNAKTDYTRANRHGSYELTAKVVGWEQVKVPAGEFTAIKITKEGRYQSTFGGSSGTGWIKSTIWYVPEIKKAVKTSYEDSNWNGSLNSRDTTELLSYKIN